MNIIQRTWSGLMAAVTAFNQKFMMSDNTNAATFESYPARLMRYAIGQAFYEGTQYTKQQPFAQGYKVDRALYKYIRNVYNPTLQVCDFYTSTIWRGSLDAGAADAGAIPITVGELADDERLRFAIATLWRESNWNVNKNIHVLHGAMMGDAVIYIRDDMKRKQVRKEILHPATVKAVELENGIVKYYELEEYRIDERGQKSTYRETAERGNGDEVIFRTYRNNTLYGWDGNEDAAGNTRAEWTEQYGFIPLVLSQHKNIGLDYGVAEIYSSIDKITEINDQASLLNDQVRKVVRPMHLANFAKRDAEIGFTTPQATTNNPQPGRETGDLLYVNSQTATITPIFTALNISDTLENIRYMWSKLEDELPEIRKDILTSNIATDTLLAARAQLESKVMDRRINYDNGEVRSNQMAIAIGGMRGYEGYDGYSLESYLAGQLDHDVSERDVFSKNQAQHWADKKMFWDTVSSVMQSTQGVIPFESIARDFGWTDEQLEDFGTQKRASILNAQEDTPPIDPITGEVMAQ
jgi:hypothetical protein